MHRYYMNSETRAALIAESKRMIAARVPGNATHVDVMPSDDQAWPHTTPLEREEVEAVDGDPADSAFAAVVSDLQSASAAARHVPQWLREFSRSRR